MMSFAYLFPSAWCTPSGYSSRTDSRSSEKGTARDRPVPEACRTGQNRSELLGKSYDNTLICPGREERLYPRTS